MPVRKKNGDIRLCVDFQNLKKSSLKDNYLLSPMEQILHTIFEADFFSFIDGFSIYNQTWVKDEYHFKITFTTKWRTFTF